MRPFAIRQHSSRNPQTSWHQFFLLGSGYAPDIQSERDGDEEDEEEDSHTETIYSVSEVGDMVDFLKACPFVTMEDYRWKLSVPMIRLMMMDNTHVNYLTDKQVERRKAQSMDIDEIAKQHSLVNDFGGTIDMNDGASGDNAVQRKETGE